AANGGVLGVRRDGVEYPAANGRVIGVGVNAVLETAADRGESAGCLIQLATSDRDEPSAGLVSKPATNRRGRTVGAVSADSAAVVTSASDGCARAAGAVGTASGDNGKLT